MTTFKIMRDRVVAELRRSNLVTEAGVAINDAIREAAKTDFYFNENYTVSFPTVAGTEFYPDQGLVQLDAAWYLQNGTTRRNLWLENDTDADDNADGNVISGQLSSLSRTGGQFRIYPVPSSVVTIYARGSGKLTPYPLVADTDTNAWMTDGEQYIRSLAKRNLLRDVIRDYGEARALDAIAEDFKAELEVETAQRSTTDRLRSTEW